MRQSSDRAALLLASSPLLRILERSVEGGRIARQALYHRARGALSRRRHRRRDERPDGRPQSRAHAQEARRSGRAAHRRHGRGRRRFPGAVARRALDPALDRQRGRGAGAQDQRPARRGGEGQSEALRRVRRDPDRRAQGRGRRARALRDASWASSARWCTGCATACSSTTSGSGRSSSAPRSSTCRSISIPACRIRP